MKFYERRQRLLVRVSVYKMIQWDRKTRIRKTFEHFSLEDTNLPEVHKIAMQAYMDLTYKRKASYTGQEYVLEVYESLGGRPIRRKLKTVRTVDPGELIAYIKDLILKQHPDADRPS